MDLADLDTPEVAFIYDSGLTTIDHNLYVVGDYAFESNYESGLRILDLSQIGDGVATEVAYFDTFPQRTAVAVQRATGATTRTSRAGSWWPTTSTTGCSCCAPPCSGRRPPRAARRRRPATRSPSPFPNPTTDGARLTLRVDEPQQVRAELYDLAGRRVAAVFSGAASPGTEVVLEVSGADLPAGVYLVRVTGERFETSRRLVLTR